MRWPPIRNLVRSIALGLLVANLAIADSPNTAKESTTSKSNALAPPTDAELRAAVSVALPLLQRGAEGHMAERKCFACHQQTMPLVAMVAARSRGFTINDEFVKKQSEFIDRFFATGRDNYLKGKGQGGAAMTAGYGLWTLELAGAEANDNTEAVVEYLLGFQKDTQHWRSTANRPPSEAGDFSATFTAVRGLRRFGSPEQKDRADQRIAEAREWLLQSTAKDTEDRVFRLLALTAAEAPADKVQAAAAELLKTQRADGGWSQLDTLESDAYATGTALWALHEAGELPTTDAAYVRGMRYLLATQKPDGSWHVRSRSKPFQDYFETGFPHEEDQYISCAATGWATAALARACKLEAGKAP